MELKRLREELYALADIMTEQLLTERHIKDATKQNRSTEPEYRAALSSLSESEREDVEERAAIMEFDGETTRDEAERRALLQAFQKRNGTRDQN